MHELTFAPLNPVWPPPKYLDPRTMLYHVARIGNAGESFLDICNRFGINFDTLIEFNFGLKRTETHYLEKINWFLKNKLGCHKTTPHGNFIFSGGETIYIPQGTISFGDVSVVGTPTEKRLSRYVYHEHNIVEPRDPEAPHPWVMAPSDLLKGWLIEKTTGRKYTPPNRLGEGQKITRDVPKSHVLIEVHIRETRDDIPTSQWVRTGSNNKTMEFDFTYGPGTPKTKVRVTHETIWNEANGNVKRFNDSHYIDQPTQYQEFE